MKRLFKRIIVWKWIIIAMWRQSAGRTVYSLHDCPLTVLRVIRFCFKDSDDDELEAIRVVAIKTIRARKTAKQYKESQGIA